MLDLNVGHIRATVDAVWKDSSVLTAATWRSMHESSGTEEELPASDVASDDLRLADIVVRCGVGNMCLIRDIYTASLIAECSRQRRRILGMGRIRRFGYAAV